ncbi:MAG: class I SAM-dependent methyltransferase [Acidimicrobiales bacterium]
MPDHRLFAATYDAALAPAERAGLADRRRRLLAGARGRVLEIGAGTGLNLAHYPAAVDHLDLVEPDGAMRARLARRLARWPSAVPVVVHGASLAEAPLAPASFDTVVSTLVLCTVPDLAAAIDHIATLLAPEGELLFLEHGRAPGARGRIQSLAGPLWRRLAAGCHLDRDIPVALREAGFVISDIERFRLARSGPLLSPAAQGVAWPRLPSTEPVPV